MTTLRLPCWAPDESYAARSADDVLVALVAESDRIGRFHGRPQLVRTLFWDHDEPTCDTVAAWLDDLTSRGDIQIRMIPTREGGRPVPVIHIVNRARFPRYRNRQWIPADLRKRVMERDDHCCQECGSTDDLSLDHIVPFSKGGPDTEDNLRVLCMPCNSRKGNRCSTSSST